MLGNRFFLLFLLLFFLPYSTTVLAEVRENALQRYWLTEQDLRDLNIKRANSGTLPDTLSDTLPLNNSTLSHSPSTITTPLPNQPLPTFTPQCQGMFIKPSTLKAVTSLKDSLKPISSLEQGSSEPDDNPEQEQDTITADKALYQPNGTATFEGDVIVESQAQRITGDYLEYDTESAIIEMQGNIQVDSDGQRIVADALTYNTESSTLNVKGDVHIENEDVLIISHNATYNNESASSSLGDADFLLFENNLNGNAASIDIAKNATRVKESTITSCPPGRESWALKSQYLELDQEKGWGYAKHASLHLARVPIFYTPYFTFPLNDKRKSGFLYPTLGSDSVNGVDIAIPYYINIAPNYDATLTPRLLSKRGIQLNGELRYLNVLGSGKISGDYLGQDKINPVFSERKQAQWQHFKQLSQSWSLSSDYYYVSDSNYFDDLNALSSSSSLGYLERNANVSYLNNATYLSILVRDFQVLDTIAEINQPYRLAPQINAGYSHNLKGFKLGLSSQLTRFERDISDSNLGTANVLNGQLTNAELITGNRLVLQPTLSKAFSSSAYFVKPALRLHSRKYQLENYQTIGQNESLSYNIPSYSLDSGLIFERPLSLLGNDYTQTLEPRIKLIKTPFTDQSTSPDFDASLLSFNSQQVFRDRRYSGHDLVGDTEQISLGLSSKLFDDSQSQKAQFSVAQIVYLEDRRIRLSSAEDTTAKLSPLVGSAQIQLFPQWLFTQSAQWDNESNHLNQFSSAVQYKNNQRQLANLEFRYRPEGTSGAQQETRVSFYWPIHRYWSAISFWNFDLNQHSTIELASGLEYENCCIVVKLLNQKWLREISSTNTFESANKQSLEIRLKGLGNLNNQVSDYLNTKIPGLNF